MVAPVERVMVIVAGLSLSDWASLATVFGVVVAVFAVIMVRSQIRISNSIRTAELIATIYNAFGEPKLSQFYAKVRKGEPIDWENNKDDEELLNRSLTLCDEVSYLQTQRLLHRKEMAWEYVASEIQYFASNESVWGYMAKRRQEGRGRGFPDDIIPFTGFPELFRNIPRRFRAKSFPEILEKHKDLFTQSLWARIRAKINRIIPCK